MFVYYLFLSNFMTFHLNKFRVIWELFLLPFLIILYVRAHVTQSRRDTREMGIYFMHKESRNKKGEKIRCYIFVSFDILSHHILIKHFIWLSSFSSFIILWYSIPVLLHTCHVTDIFTHYHIMPKKKTEKKKQKKCCIRYD